MITLQASDGAAVTLTACAGCERRRWRREGEEVELGELLADLALTGVGTRRAS